MSEELIKVSTALYRIKHILMDMCSIPYTPLELGVRLGTMKTVLEAQLEKIDALIVESDEKESKTDGE